jgi:K+:H+ antiporter
MTVSTLEVAHLLIALTIVLLAAHLVGGLFAALRQPPVIGEILGGLLLGPTALGEVAPGLQHQLLPATGDVSTVFNAVYQLGQLLLLFLAGAELRQVARGRAERRVAVFIAIVGIVVPFTAGTVLEQFLDYRSLAGPHGSATTITLVFGIAVAITSIPVISRIMLDLGIMETALARIVLTVAVVEDIVLYLVLAVVLGIAQAHSTEGAGFSTLLGNQSIPVMTLYYVAASVVFFAVTAYVGPIFFRWVVGLPHNYIERRYPAAMRLLYLLVVVLCCVALSINPIFGALMAGLTAARGDARADADDPARAELARVGWDSIRQFSLSFFIPLFFALVGFKLDLIRQFDIVFFCWFLVFACVVKSLSVWAAARLAGEGAHSANQLAVAMNARGGPGIVLATVTLAAGVVNAQFFTAIVVLSIVTSEIAGVWLGREFGQVTAKPAVRLAVPALGADADG